MRELPHTHSCFVCGESNPAGLKLRLETDGRLVQTRFMLRPEFAGFRDTIHGGVIATILDEVMVWACAVQTKRFAYCAELSVRYVHPARPGEEVLAAGQLEQDRRGRVFEASARLTDSQNRVLATAAGKYIPVREADRARMATDFVGDTEMLR